MTCLHLVVKHQDMNTSAYVFILVPLLTVGQFILLQIYYHEMVIPIVWLI